MIVALVGDSGSGKSTIEDYLSVHGYDKIISHTTRKPRDKEVNGKDYHFVTREKFDELKENGYFAEYEEYSQDRFYGTLKTDYAEQSGNNKVIVITPNGLRQLKKSLGFNENLLTIYVKTNLGNRIIRYIKRCGVDKFTFDEKNEIAARVERDFGMFLGIESSVDCVIDGNQDEYHMCLSVMNEIEKKKTENQNRLWS